MRIALLLGILVLAAACAAPLPSLQERTSSDDTFDNLDAIREGRYDLSPNVGVTIPLESSFTLGNVKEDWDSTERYELNFLFHLPEQKGYEPQFGGYIFWESRDWRSGISDFDYDAVGFGLEPGATFYLLDKKRGKVFNLGLRPYARFGLGFQDGVFHHIRSDEGFATGNVSGERFEGALGLDLQAIFGDFLLASIGVGGMLWYADHPKAETVNAAGTVVDDDDRLDLDGEDLFARFSVGFKF